VFSVAWPNASRSGPLCQCLGLTPSRSEVIYNVEPFRGAVRQGDWKLIWRTLIPTSVDLYNLAEDPYEKNNIAAAHLDKVAAMQERLNVLGKESAKPLALVYVTSVGLAHGKPLMASEDGKGPALVEDDGHAITDEGFGDSRTPDIGVLKMSAFFVMGVSGSRISGASWSLGKPLFFG